jgi:hypothetical protein
MLKAYERGKGLDGKLQSDLLNARAKCLDLQQKTNGSKSRSEIGEKNEYPTIWTYLWAASGSANSTYGPTKSHKKSLTIANKIFNELTLELNAIKNLVNPLKNKMETISAPLIRNK